MKKIYCVWCGIIIIGILIICILYIRIPNVNPGFNPHLNFGESQKITSSIYRIDIEYCNENMPLSEYHIEVYRNISDSGLGLFQQTFAKIPILNTTNYIFNETGISNLHTSFQFFDHDNNDIVNGGDYFLLHNPKPDSKYQICLFDPAEKWGGEINT